MRLIEKAKEIANKKSKNNYCPIVFTVVDTPQKYVVPFLDEVKKISVLFTKNSSALKIMYNSNTGFLLFNPKDKTEGIVEVDVPKEKIMAVSGLKEIATYKKFEELISRIGDDCNTRFLNKRLIDVYNELKKTQENQEGK